jgi:hypothetical protein
MGFEDPESQLHFIVAELDQSKAINVAKSVHFFVELSQLFMAQELFIYKGALLLLLIYFPDHA